MSEKNNYKFNEARFGELLASIPDAYVVADHNGRIVMVNKQTEDCFGYSQVELINQPLVMLIPERFHERHLKGFGEYFSNPFTRTIGPDLELYGLRKDGSEFPIHVRISPVRTEQGVLIAGAVRDITEIKKLQDQLLRAQRLESIGTLAGGIAHDLNNVLAPITLSIQLLREYEEKNDDNYRNWIDMIEESTQRATKLISQVLTFGRGGIGEYEVIKPGSITKEVIKILRQTFPKSVNIDQNIYDDTWDISGDVTQLHQVLMNMCVNARDAMPEGGTLKIDVENINLDKHYAEMNHYAEPGPYVAITVTDTGTGIPRNNIDKIFDPFFTTKDPGKGTGLGLSTTFKIIRDHGGFINVYSELGKGTTFRIYIPAVSSTIPRESPLNQDTNLTQGCGETILIVDDEATVREITKFTLENNGYNVLTSVDGIDAIAVFTKNNSDIDLIIMDTMMPNMDGPSSIEVLRRIDPDIRIIISSGLREGVDILERKNIKVNAKLTKPYTSETLLKSIRRTLDSGKD